MPDTKGHVGVMENLTGTYRAGEWFAVFGWGVWKKHYRYEDSEVLNPNDRKNRQYKAANRPALVTCTAPLVQRYEYNHVYSSF